MFEFMESNQKIERIFKKIQLAINDIINGTLPISSISERMKGIDKSYHQSQIMKGLDELGFHTFTPEEQLCLIMSANHIYNNGIQPFNTDSISKGNIAIAIRKGKELLIERGLVRYVAYDTDVPEKNACRKDRVMLSAEACGKIFHGMKNIISYERMARQVEIIKSSTINSKVLFFEKENQNDIQRIYKALAEDKYKEVMSRLKDMKRRPAITCLFYGAPGTGKTELAKQLAKATGRDIMIADVSKLHGSFTGDTEKNYREMFLGYKYLEKISDNPPILLFNEADGILGKRGNVMRQAIDKISNRIQNILLQEMEDFEGIFIATTNLASNLDPAFERRLLYKIEFKQPGEEVRKKIWKTMIPELEDVYIDILASKYNFSGGQIENVATKRDLDYIIEGTEPSILKIQEYCETEMIKSKNSMNKIGFRTKENYKIRM